MDNPRMGFNQRLLPQQHKNGFNNTSRFQIMWNVQHWWARGDHFDFNYYRDIVKLLVYLCREVYKEAFLF